MEERVSLAGGRNLATLPSELTWKIKDGPSDSVILVKSCYTHSVKGQLVNILELWENIFLLFELPSLRDFVMAAQVDWYNTDVIIWSQQLALNCQQNLSGFILCRNGCILKEKVVTMKLNFPSLSNLGTLIPMFLSYGTCSDSFKWWTFWCFQRSLVPFLLSTIPFPTAPCIIWRIATETVIATSAFCLLSISRVEWNKVETWFRERVWAGTEHQRY